MENRKFNIIYTQIVNNNIGENAEIQYFFSVL